MLLGLWASVGNIPDADRFVEIFLLDLGLNHWPVNLGCRHRSERGRVFEPNIVVQCHEVLLVLALLLQGLRISSLSHMGKVRSESPQLETVIVTVLGHEGKSISNFSELLKPSAAIPLHGAAIVYDGQLC